MPGVARGIRGAGISHASPVAVEVGTASRKLAAIPVQAEARDQWCPVEETVSRKRRPRRRGGVLIGFWWTRGEHEQPAGTGAQASGGRRRRGEQQGHGAPVARPTEQRAQKEALVDMRVSLFRVLFSLGTMIGDDWVFGFFGSNGFCWIGLSKIKKLVRKFNL